MPIPYIHFDGHCAEALAFYADVFGAEDLSMMRYSDAPEMDDTMRDPTRVIHGQLTLPDGMLMASDYPPGMPADPQSAVSIMTVADTVSEGQRLFNALSDHGHVVQGFGPSFFSRGFGMLKDRYGTHWMISVAPEEPLDATADA
ncbi:VOC family protein [Paragemmobacter straminiformis]|uniref:VOC family protein n=1 Tax=Paragemmobacter straminiformis TaxID=2045119 RepID=A0A842IAJ1_9RHOB|nr:VOC family protein [Gemmobacter straminiformis]MBC2836423.1 VOC family protein [Gemmobacter straminiformis]